METRPEEIQALQEAQERAAMMGIQSGSPMDRMFQTQNVKEVIQEYLKETIPEEKKFWGLRSNSITLGFNDGESKTDYLIEFELMKLNNIMEAPPEDYTWEKMQDFNQLRFNLLSRINRSILRPSGGMNERTAQISQVSQNISSSTLNNAGGGSGVMGELRAGIRKVLG